MWTITLRMEIQNSSNQSVKTIECKRWTGKHNDPFYVAHTDSEVLQLNRNNILSIVKKKSNDNYQDCTTNY